VVWDGPRNLVGKIDLATKLPPSPRPPSPCVRATRRECFHQMTPLRFILASLRHNRQVHVAVAAGVAVATAVLTGALLVGDSVRGSLRDLTLQRLGRIDEVLVSPHFFREALAGELAEEPAVKQNFAAAEPAILIPGNLQAGNGDYARRATQISVVGCREGFWSLGQGGPGETLAEDEIVITESVARELGTKVGDSILLRIPVAQAIPADSMLGKKNGIASGHRLKVAAVLPPEGLARFGLLPSQQLPRNAFVPLATLQELLKKPGKANAILVAGRDSEAVPDEAADGALQTAFHPRLEDYGLRISHVSSPEDYNAITSEQLVLSDAAVVSAETAFAEEHPQPIVAYLANSLVVGEGDAERKIPYSTLAGVDSTAGLGPLLDDSHKPMALADDEIVLNRWAVDDLGAKVGDMVTVNFYEPESTHGVLHEHEPPVGLRLAHVVELENEGKPTAAADPHLLPELPGVTDQKSIHDWDLPFELVEKVRTQDEAYWDKYRTTPKAFVSLATAKRLWASRWGTISMLRVGTGEHVMAPDDAANRLAKYLEPAALGMKFLPMKRLGLAAASGTTPFDGLFLGFSFFLIAAAVMLIALLFKLGIEQRARELGILAAAGFDRIRITRLLAWEGLIVAAGGAAIGAVAGVIYAWPVITGLCTWWVAAIAAPFLRLHVSLSSLAIGWLIGAIVSWVAIRLAIRRLVRLSAARLLVGVTEADPFNIATETSTQSQWSRVREAFVALAVALAVLGYVLRGEAQAGVFLCSGAAVLLLLIGETRYQLRMAARNMSELQTFRLAALSALNTTRNTGRSVLTIGLVATATFLIVAISAFRLETGEEGTGGFTLSATSDQPIQFDLNTQSGRAQLGFSDRDAELLNGWSAFSLRVSAGEDASCLNLYRPTQPRVLGVPESLIERGGFGWAERAQSAGEGIDGNNPWTLLGAKLGKDDAGRPIVPVVLDTNTAAYSLHLGGVGSRMVIRDAANRPVTVEVVGLLSNSILQGNLLMSEANFLPLFPDTGGYRYFLIAPKAGGTATREDAESVARALETTLAAEGLDATDAREQLASYLAVQNTYLSTFQSLGALGLLLGTVGLAVVQLRSVLQRRGELAILRAAGFPRRRLVVMVVGENGVLLVGGLIVGVVAAAVALIPQWSPHGASVPWDVLLALLGAIGVVGLVAGWLATRSALSAPLMPALRGD
jgi:putative ABC transport system permease protein